MKSLNSQHSLLQFYINWYKSFILLKTHFDYQGQTNTSAPCLRVIGIFKPSPSWRNPAHILWWRLSETIKLQKPAPTLSLHPANQLSDQGTAWDGRENNPLLLNPDRRWHQLKVTPSLRSSEPMCWNMNRPQIHNFHLYWLRLIYISFTLYHVNSFAVYSWEINSMTNATPFFL